MTTEILPEPTLTGLAQIGAMFPPEYLETLAEHARETAREWLRANNAPEELIELLDLSVCLDLAAQTPAGASDPEGDFFFSAIPEQVAEATRYIALLGGQFSNCVSRSIPREPLRWHPSQAASD